MKSGATDTHECQSPKNEKSLVPYPTPTLPYPTLPLPYPTLPLPLPYPYPTLPYPTLPLPLPYPTPTRTLVRNPNWQILVP